MQGKFALSTKESPRKFILLVLAGLLTFMDHTLATHSQWAKISFSNEIPANQSIQVVLQDFNLFWGHFYDCSDETRKKLDISP